MEPSEIINLYKSGLSTKKLEKICHINSKKIKNILFENGIDIHSRGDSKCGPRLKRCDGFWADKKNCEDAAKQCRNRGEFNKKFSAAWKSSKEHGWLDEFTEKYFNNRPEFPSLYSKIHLIYAYEINVRGEKYVYVGRTNSLKRRDKQHRNDKKDTLYIFCNKNNVDIPSPIVLIENIDGYESQVKENECINEYRNNGWSILNVASTGFGSGSLGAISPKWNYETCCEAAKLCSSKEEFKKKYSRAHNVSRTNGWIDVFFPNNLKKENGYFDTFENCLEEAKRYGSIMEIRKNYPFLYQKISKNKWTELIKPYLDSTKKKYFDCTYFNFNKTFNKMGVLTNEEKEIYIEMKGIDRDIVIDSKSERNSLFILRQDTKHIIFLFINVSKNGSFLTNKKNTFFKDFLRSAGKNGYRLIEIYDVEYREKKKLVLEKIKYFLGCSDSERVMGRKCVIREIEKSDAEPFMNRFHIQGFCSSSVYLGAFWKDSLVAVMSFKHGGINRKEWELVRFASDYDYVFSGVGGKLFSHFIKTYSPSMVVSFADSRWGIMNENLYTKIGFKKDGETRPSYKYFVSNGTPTALYHKFTFRKTPLCKKYGLPMTMTEAEMAKKIGYDRIWDCGLIRYVWTKEKL